MMKRIYAELNMIPKDESEMKLKFSIPNYGLVQHYFPSMLKFQIHTEDQCQIDLDELKSNLEYVLQLLFDENFQLTNYHQLITFFLAVSKHWDNFQLDNIVNEVLDGISYKLIESICTCESIIDLSNSWINLCKNYQKVKVLLFNLPQNDHILDLLCSKCLPRLKQEDIINIYNIILRDFLQFDESLLFHIREVSDFISKIGIYTKEFSSQFHTEILAFLTEQQNQLMKLSMNEQLNQLWDILNLLNTFSSCLLRGEDKINCFNDLSSFFSTFFFDQNLKIQLPQLISENNITEIKKCSQISNAIQMTEQFLDLFEEYFNSYIEDLLSAKDSLFENLLKITSQINDYKESLFGKQFIKKLTTSFRKLFNQDPSLISIQVAIGIDKIFRNESQPDINSLFSLFKLLQMKDLFESYHTHLLMERIRHNNCEVLSSDIILVDKIKSYCNEIYTKRFDLLIENAEFSKKAFFAFQEDFEVPDCFKVFLFHSDLLPDQNFQCNLPPVMSIISNQYLAFLIDRFPKRKYEWSIPMTKAKLAYKTNSNTLFSVKCSGHFASLLLTFNNSDENGKTIEELSEETNMTYDTIRSMLKILSKKVNLIEKKHDRYIINKLNLSKKIKIPTSNAINLVSFNSEKNKQYILDNQIDCLVIRILKDQKTCPKNLLFQMIKEEIDNMTEKKFISRIDNLKKKFLIVEDAFHTLKYI